MNETAKLWLGFAREDLRMAELALKEGIFNQACFHAQQCVEKGLKALIEFRGRVAPRTHSIADLLAALAERDRRFVPGRELLRLDRFYIPTRYPDAWPGSLPEGLPRQADAEHALSIARQSLKAVTEILKIPSVSQQGEP
jgi:HEPN domain-containing protein